MTSTATLTLTGGTSGSTVITGTGNADALNGSTAADIISGGAGADTIANQLTGTAATAGDVLTGGAGFDTFIVRGSAASGALDGLLLTTSTIADFTVGATATTSDILQLGATATDYQAGAALFNGVAAAVAGLTAVQTVAQNATATAIVAGVDLIKLTTGVATTGLTAAQAFSAAIGTASVTGFVAANDDMFVSMYDTTNSRMLVMLVDSGADSAISTVDTVRMIGSLSMSAADYASFGANNLSII